MSTMILLVLVALVVIAIVVVTIVVRGSLQTRNTCLVFLGFL